MYFLQLLAIFTTTSSGLLIPSVSPGQYAVGLNIETLTDETRWDPYAPADNPQRRRVLVSAFIPASLPNQPCQHGEVNVTHMPPKTAAIFGKQAESMGLPQGFFENLEMGLCRLPDPESSTQKLDRKNSEFPVVIFSPGRGVSRLMYSVMAWSMASHGYVVLTLDHAYDATIIEYPDGTSVTGVVGEANQTVLEKSVEVRRQDVSFVIDQIADASTAKRLLAQTEVDRIFVFGQSIGGATVVSALFNDDRIQGAINLDGDMLGPVVKKGLDKPLFLIGKPHSREMGPSWNQTWENQRGPGMMIQVDGTTHQSFTDLPLLANLRDIPKGPKVEAAIGTIDGKQMTSLMTELMVSVLENVFDDSENGLCGVVGGRGEVTILETKGISCP